MAKKKDEKKIVEGLAESYKDVSPYIGLGFQLAASVLLMLYAGYKLDEYLDTSPLLMIIFALFGAGAGIYHVIKSASDLNKKKKDDKQKH